MPERRFVTRLSTSTDLEIWIEPAVKNAERTLRALQRFGAPAGDVSVDDPTDSTTIYQIGVSGNRIEILATIARLSFEDAWRHRGSHDFGESLAPVLSDDDLIISGENTGRAHARRRVRLLRKARTSH